MMRYREFDVEAPEYQPMAYFSSDVDEDPAAWLQQHPRHLLHRRGRPETQPKADFAAIHEQALGRDSGSAGFRSRPSGGSSYERRGQVGRPTDARVAPVHLPPLTLQGPASDHPARKLTIRSQR